MSEESATLDRPAAVCRVLREGTPFIGKQGFTYAPAISLAFANSRAR